MATGATNILARKIMKNRAPFFLFLFCLVVRIDASLAREQVDAEIDQVIEGLGEAAA